MIVTKRSLPRRTFLRGAGAAMALPFLDAMSPALASPVNSAAKPPIRLGFVYVPNGVIDLNGEWTPKGEGTGFEFTSTLKPLEPFRDRLLVLSGLAQINGRSFGEGGGDHARAGASWLTGAHPTKSEANIYAGVSADQVAARELGKATQLASLEIGLEEPDVVGGCDSGYSCAYTNTVSWRTPTTPVPVEDNPRRIFERLFGDGDSTDPAARLARLREQRTILDFVREDLARLSSGLGQGDLRKLDEYLTAVRDVERRIDHAERQSAEMKMPVMERPSGVPDNFDEHSKLMIDLQVLAYQTDMTRVITFMMGREGSNRSYPSIGVPDAHHPCTHHQNDPEKIAKTTKINELHVRTLAYMLEKMRSTPDGDGTLLDHAMIVYGSSIGDGNQHTHHDLPIVVAGGGAGSIQGGRHLRFPAETPMNNLLVTMLAKGGVPVEKLGDSTGRLPELSGV